MTTSLNGGAATQLDGLVVTGNASVSGALLLTNTPTVSTAQSCVRLNTSNGYGSTNTVIRRFTNVVTNQGSDITYADSATLGATFTINTNGVYAIAYSEGFSGSATFGVTLNSAQLTTNFSSTTVADRVAAASCSAANVVACASTTVYLTAGAVIRAHADATGTGATASLFTITRVS